MDLNLIITLACTGLSIWAAVYSFLSFRNKRHADRVFAKLIKNELEPPKDRYQKKSSYGREPEKKEEVLNEPENKYKEGSIGLGILNIDLLAHKIQNSKDREIILKTLESLNSNQKIDYINDIISLSALTGTYQINMRYNDEIGLTEKLPEKDKKS